MVKIFERDGKINFVDDNNVFVGFDYNACCCERFGYFISNKIEAEIPPTFSFDLSEYHFDTKFFHYGTIKCEENYDDNSGVVVFRMIAENKPELFLHFYNSHNGYYGHGFEAKIGGLDWQEGCL